MQDCNSIERLVDRLGTLSFLASITNLKLDQVIDHGSRVKPVNMRNGLFFSGAHWYAVVDNEKYDSYKEGYQIESTAHFCQTFAAMIYLMKTEELSADYTLISGKYSDNIKKAMAFLINEFDSYPEIAAWFIEQMDSPTITTRAKLKGLLNDVSKSSADLIACKTTVD